MVNDNIVRNMDKVKNLEGIAIDTINTTKWFKGSDIADFKYFADSNRIIIFTVDGKTHTFINAVAEIIYNNQEDITDSYNIF